MRRLSAGLTRAKSWSWVGVPLAYPMTRRSPLALAPVEGSLGAAEHLEAEGVALHPNGLILLAGKHRQKVCRSGDCLAGGEDELLPLHLFLVERSAAGDRQNPGC